MQMFSAQIKNGQLMADGGQVVNCPILGNGGDSSGVIVISGSELAYIPNTTPDLSDNIDYIVAALNSISSALNSISSGVLPENGGGAITTGGFTSGIEQGTNGISQAVNNLNKLKARLK